MNPRVRITKAETPSSPRRPLHVLVAGPYRSGTGDDPAKIATNLQAMNHAALAVYRMGHLPAVGEWYALPLMEAAGSKALDDAPFQEIFHPSAARLLDLCDAVLRVGGPSAGADEIVRMARDKGKRVFTNLGDVPAPA